MRRRLGEQQPPRSILCGVEGTSLRGLYGHIFLPLDDVLREVGVVLSSGLLAAIHAEVCLAYATMPVDYTGGSHRSMGIMPPSRTDEAVGDYLEVVRELEGEEWQTFIALADDPTGFRDVDRADIGEERSVPLSRRQMLWLKVRHGVYFPWKGYLELIPNQRWTDKDKVDGKRFTRAARTFLPQTCALVESLPFVGVGRCNVMGLEAHDHGTVHRDGDPAEQTAPDHFITLSVGPPKTLFLWDEASRREHPVAGATAVWFNDFDYHGVIAHPYFRYSIRIDGVFTDSFLSLITERFS
jgi:hypothetical protein